MNGRKQESTINYSEDIIGSGLKIETYIALLDDLGIKQGETITMNSSDISEELKKKYGEIFRTEAP